MCSYCGCQANTVIGRLMDEHVAVINATGELRSACHAGDLDEVRRHALRVAALLCPHTRDEEVGIFAVLAEQDEFTDHVHSLCAEHTALDDLLDAVAAGATERIDDFEHALRHHIDREDNGLFPAAAIALEGEDWDRVEELETSDRAARNPLP